ncbi:MAG: hypothetical protein KGS48_01585 [Bacteroidetes bacterium]|nr:hypothetical protein [Bacteroidota bacterium]
MTRSKLLEFLRSLNTREWKSFLEMVESPFFNRNAALVQMCVFLHQKAPQFEDISRETLFEAVFPGEAPDDALLNHTMSFLLKLGHQFLALQQLEQQPLLQAQLTLQGLLDRNLEKHYRLLYDKTHKQLDNSPLRDARHHYNRYWIENMEANRRAQSAARVFNAPVQAVADHLDYFYLAEKLRCTCHMLTSQVVLATQYNLQLVEEVYRFLQNHPLPEDAPAVHAYFYVFQLLRDDQAHPSFEALKSLLESRAKQFSQQELAELYQYAINYCNFQILKLREAFVEEALQLYIRGVDSGILLQNDKLSPWHYKNMIKLALRLKKFDWTEQFIQQNTHLLEDAFRDDAFFYNLAELYYYTGRLDEALTFLNKVDFSDIHYNLGAKVLLVKIYYETEASDALESLLHAFKTFLQRNKVISEELRLTYLNFIQMVRQMLRMKPKQYAALRETVLQQPLLTDKNWLIRMLS